MYIPTWDYWLVIGLDAAISLSVAGVKLWLDQS